MRCASKVTAKASVAKMAAEKAYRKRRGMARKNAKASAWRSGSVASASVAKLSGETAAAAAAKLTAPAWQRVKAKMK